MKKVTYRFPATVWLYPGMAGWHFISLDKGTAAKVRKQQEGKLRRGWGSIPVSVTIGKSTWKTSIFPDKGATYLLPLKAEIRKREGIFEGDRVNVTLAV